MRISDLGPGKKRYAVTLTEENAEYIRRCLKEWGTPPVQFSLMLDDFVKGMAELFRNVIDKGGKITYGQMLKVLGEHMEHIEAREEQIPLPKAEKKTVSTKSSRVAHTRQKKG